MIVVVGRPRLDERRALDGMAARVALDAAAAGARVELLGTVGDDEDGDAAVLALGRAGIGHAAVLRDPAGVTPRAGGAAGPPPRLDARDVELGLAYLPECRVLVLAEAVDVETRRTAGAAAAYHRAALIALVPAGEPARGGAGELPPTSTVLEVPEEDGPAFAALVGRYAAALAAGRPPEEAWRGAVGGTGWEQQARA